jgi:PII-like signaling protein
MKVNHNGTLMRIILSESRRKDHAQMYRAIIDALNKAGLAGATVFKGIEGFGSHRYISRASIVDGYVDLPILIEVVDEDEKVRNFMPTLERVLDDGIVTLERVQTIFYRASGDEV